MDACKWYKFQVKSLDPDTGQLRGYLSTFGNIDLGGDIVERGAFIKTLQENRAFPLYWAHDWTEPKKLVGSFHGAEDSKGLFIEGEFLPDQDSQNVRIKLKALLDKGVKIGLSIGYEVVKELMDKVNSRVVRRLKELKLNEGSIAMFPMNPEAAVTGVKAQDAKINEPGEPTREDNGGKDAEPDATSTPQDKSPEDQAPQEADGLPLIDQAAATAKAILNLMEEK